MPIVNISHKKIDFDNGPKRDAFQLEAFGGAARERLYNQGKFTDNQKGKGFAYKKSVKPEFSVPE